MTTPEYTLEPGVDPTGTFAGYAPTLLQMVQIAVPNAYRGMVIVSETAPATTGQPTGYATDWYAWQKRCVWVKASTGEVYVYKTGVGWQSIQFGAGSIVGSLLTDHTVNISKLLVTGTAGQVIRVNAGATAFENVSIATAVGTNSLPPTILTGSSAGKFVGYSGGGPAWVLIDQSYILGLLGNGSIQNVKLAPSTSKYILRTNAAETATEWASLATIIEDNTISLSKLVSAATGDVGKVLTVQADGTWATGAVNAITTSGNASKIVAINSGGTAIEYLTPTSILETAAQFAQMYIDTTGTALDFATIDATCAITLYAGTNISHTMTTDATTGKLIAAVAGKYRVCYDFKLTAAGGIFDFLCGIALNGATAALSGTVSTAANCGTAAQRSYKYTKSCIVTLAAGDYIKILTNLTGGSNNRIDIIPSYVTFSAEKIG